jgi:hypothetical protein
LRRGKSYYQWRAFAIEPRGPDFPANDRFSQELLSGFPPRQKALIQFL